MQYRTLGKTALTVSALGFGAMRLPTRGQDSEIDQSAALEMLRWALEQGVTYIDTAHVYHGGNSERVVGLALANGARQRVCLATKLPIWNVHSLADCDRILEEQLTRLQTDYIDCYLLHCLQAKSWRTMSALGVVEWAERQRARGRIRHFGFSFHDDLAAFTRIVDDYDWSFCQIQYNYVSEDVQAGTQGLRYAAAKGLGVIIMEPLFGGTLATPPPTVQRLWDDAPDVGRPVDLALQWLWNQPEVSLVLSGMGTLEQVQQNVASACRARVGGLETAQRDLIAQVRDEYQRLAPIPCSKCGYCLPCPNGVNIPGNFELFNQAHVFQGRSVALCRNLYLALPEAERAAACAACGTCEDRCPQQIPIAEQLGRVREQFA